jgi:hypothetical protein
MYDNKVKRHKEKRLELVKAIFRLLDIKDKDNEVTRSRIKKLSKRWGRENGLDEEKLLEISAMVSQRLKE